MSIRINVLTNAGSQKRPARLVRVLSCGLSALIAVLVMKPAGAVPLTLTNQGLSLEVDSGTTNFLFDSTAPIGGGNFNGFHTNIWYRIGATGGERALGSLRLLSESPSDSGGDGSIESVLYRFEDIGERFLLNVRYTVVGRDPDGVATIQEEIAFANQTAAELDLHLFLSSYVDLDVNLGLESDRDYDHVAQTSPTQMHQSSPRGSRLDTFLLSPVAPNQVAITQRPTSFPGGPRIDILGDALRDLSPTNLATLSSGNRILGDQWAWQWDRIVAADAGFGIVLRHRFSNANVPEPPGWTLWVVALMIVGMRRVLRGASRPV